MVWTAGDRRVLPIQLRTIAADAAVQPPFAALLARDLRGDPNVHVGWAILLPRPSYAQAMSVIGDRADISRAFRDVPGNDPEPTLRDGIDITG